MQDINFIAETVKTMCKDVESTETIKKIVGSANQYAKLRKFPMDKSQWTDEHLDMYFTYIEKIVDMPTEFTQGDFDTMNIEEKLSAVGIETENIESGIQEAGDMLGGVVKKMAEQINIVKTLSVLTVSLWYMTIGIVRRVRKALTSHVLAMTLLYVVVILASGVSHGG